MSYANTFKSIIPLDYRGTLTWADFFRSIAFFMTAGGLQGVELASYASLSQPTSGGAPPPPPPPPPPVAAPAAQTGGGAAAVFADLNRGEEVTKGLRKVDKSEMTHKNPALRQASTVPSSPSPCKSIVSSIGQIC